MPANPHPLAMVQFARQRHAEFHALAARERLARRAKPRAERQAWMDLAAVIAVVVARGLLLATGAA